MGNSAGGVSPCNGDGVLHHDRGRHGPYSGAGGAVLPGAVAGVSLSDTAAADV